MVVCGLSGGSFVKPVNVFDKSVESIASECGMRDSLRLDIGNGETMNSCEDFPE